MKKITTLLTGALSLCLLLTGCGKNQSVDDLVLAENAFNPQSTVRTRVQQELANNTSYANIDYLANYSFAAKVDTLVSVIKRQFEAIAPHVSTNMKTLEFTPLKTEIVISEGSENHYYLINDKIVANFIVPKSNSVAWNGTVSNIQFYYSVLDPSAAQLMDFISKSIVQEIESPTTSLLIEREGYDDEVIVEPVRNYQFVGGAYETAGNLINLNSQAIDFIFSSLNLKTQDYLYCFDFQRVAY